MRDRTPCYWRFKGTLEWKWGYPVYLKNGLYRMARWKDDEGGTIVLAVDIETLDV